MNTGRAWIGCKFYDGANHMCHSSDVAPISKNHNAKCEKGLCGIALAHFREVDAARDEAFEKAALVTESNVSCLKSETAAAIRAMKVVPDAK